MKLRFLSVILVLVVAPAGAADAKHRRHHHRHKHAQGAKPAPRPSPDPAPPSKPMTFAGSCDFSGAVTFEPAMTNTPQHVDQEATAPGTCTGTVTDGAGNAGSLDKAPVTYAAKSGGDSISCGEGTASGSGRLLLPQGALGFKFAETRLAATPFFELTGNTSGAMRGYATPSAQQDAAQSVQDCNGSGLKRFLIDMHLETMPSITG